MMAYKMKEVSRIVGVSTRTLMRWFKEGKIQEVDRDRNNHRIFEQVDIERIKGFADRRIAAPVALTPHPNPLPKGEGKALSKERASA